MTLKTITFQQTFPTGPYANVRLGVEIDINDYDYERTFDNESIAAEAFKHAKKIVYDNFNAMYGSQQPDLSDKTLNENLAQWKSPEPIPEVKVERPKNSQDAIIFDINTCKDIKMLETYKMIANAKGNEKVKEAYQDKLKELS